MAIFPVIMCGGSGTRLWPASRPSRPKQFIALAGNRSLFHETVERVADLATNGGRLIVIGGVAHSEIIADQLAEVGVEAQVLLEPQPRDSAAAMAAAAAWVRRHDPDGIICFVASDHYIPDAEAFRRAVIEAAAEARNGRIVTLGVQPTEPSSAYGYIKPAGPGLSPVESFHEKPDAETAATLIDDGYLWNSGNFIVSSQTLLNELNVHAPAIVAAATRALSSGRGSTQTLQDAFLSAPKISIDYALMERTQKASVLPADFAWSDLGAWDAVAASGEGSTGTSVLEDADRVLTRAPAGVLIAALGVSDIAIVVESDAVLVCDIARSQDIRVLIERVRTTSPQHIDFQAPSPMNLEEGGRWFADWLRLRALPLWATQGFRADGGFVENLNLAGRASLGPRRARVQARQIFVYAQAGILGWQGPWLSIVTAALARLRHSYFRPDGASRTLLAADWTPIDESAVLYDQAFVLFALAAARQAGVEDAELEVDAARLRDHLLLGAMPNGAFPEVGDQPYQSNAHMHLFEAALAWERLSDDPAWSDLADRIASLATFTFIDAEGGFLREFFSEDWTPAAGADGALVEPGHQFEWSWLLARYAIARGDAGKMTFARTLYEVGRKGVTHRPPIAVDAMNDDLTPRSRRSRLWPQTEWLKASLLLAEKADGVERDVFLADAAAAFRALKLYLLDDGLWRDKRLPNGDFIDEPSPASSFYHIIAAFDQMTLTTKALGVSGGVSLNLA